MVKRDDYVVVWSGKDELLPSRTEHWDGRFAGMPNLDLDEVVPEVKPKRKYNKTGQHVGEFSRKRGWIPKDQRTTADQRGCDGTCD